MKRVLIWDLSTRVLHLAFAGGITVALVLGFLVDDDSPLFAYHMLAGLFAGGALVVRLVLGVVGPRHTRFGDWPLGLKAVWRFVRGLAGGRGDEAHAGHNPGAAWVMLAMFAVAAGLGVTGLQGGEDLHELLAWGMVGLIGGHLAGIAAHSMRRRENLAMAMVDGRKQAAEESALAGHGWWRGALVRGVMASWGGVLWSGFDAGAGTLALPGLSVPLQLGEDEHGPGGEDGRKAEHERHEKHFE